MIWGALRLLAPPPALSDTLACAGPLLAVLLLSATSQAGRRHYLLRMLAAVLMLPRLLRLSLPPGGAAPPVQPAPAAAPLPRAAARVLVVDDEPKIADLVSAMLQGAGFEVDRASSGTAALRRTADTHFGAIVSDLRMPDIDGAALWRAVQQRDTGLARRMRFVTGDTLSPVPNSMRRDSFCRRPSAPRWTSPWATPNCSPPCSAC